MRVRSTKDLAGGLMMAAIGGFFLAGALGLTRGTASRMGPGYFPLVLSLIMITLALLIIVRCVQVDGRLAGAVAWRPLVWVSLSILAFALALPLLGLAPAVVLSVLIAAVADHSSRPLGTILLAVGLAFGTWLIFRLGLGLPMPAFRELPWRL